MHEDDLSGWLIEKMKSGDSDANQWAIIRLPALADDEHDLLGRAIGEPLWPERFGLAALARVRANTFARDGSALYQQQPTDAAGAAGKFGLTDRQRGGCEYRPNRSNISPSRTTGRSRSTSPCSRRGRTGQER